MKDKLIQIRVDAEFLSKLEYLRLINGFKTTAETIRKIVDKEWRKEQKRGRWIDDGFCRTCSECGIHIVGGDYNYCHNCGAKMTD